MSARTMWMLIAGVALCVSSLPNSREVPAAASDGLITAMSAPAPTEVAPAADYELSPTAAELFGQMASKYCPPTSEPMTVCTPEGCYVVDSQPAKSVVRTRTVSYAAPVRQTVTYSSRQPVFRSNERFMQRGPARRFAGRVGRGVCRVAFAPIRWLRCR